MRELIRLKNPGLTKLNNAEYLNLLTRAKGLILATGPDKLGIEADVMPSYTEYLNQLGDLVARSYAQAETPEMAELEKQRDALGMYIVDNVRNAQNVPIAAKAASGKALWLVVKPYEKFYALPNQQETMVINGLVNDLSKEENAEHVATLALADYVAELATVNARYQMLTDQRTSQRAAEKTADSATLRKELDVLYDYVTTVAFCESVAKPTEATAQFITELNAVVAEINALYNQRVAQGKKEENKDESEAPSDAPTGEETEVPETPEDSETPENAGN